MSNELDTLPPIHLERPGADQMAAATSEHAIEVAPGIWCSPGLSNAYMLTTADGRVVVNTGMGFESPVHRAVFDAVDDSPIRYVVLTQGHYDHVGGLDQLRDPDTRVVAHADWRLWRDDNQRLAAYRASRSSFAFTAKVMAGRNATKERFGHVPDQSVPHVDIEVHDNLTLTVGGRTLELLATPGGETTDSLVVWLPEERICLAGNTFGALFGHIPNLVTMRGDRYRDALTVIDSIDRVRELGAEVLLTGHFEPIVGGERIRAELTRLRGAVEYLHDEVVAGMNAGKDVHTLMREITLSPALAVGEGYGKVPWNVRAIWENYSGWFHHRSTTELYDVAPSAPMTDLVELAGVEAVLARATEHLDSGRPVHAIYLAEAIVQLHPNHEASRALLVRAHRQLLEASTNFWESAWLTKQIGAYS
ncbi:MBL fold metallo-hydrolase [Nocardia elegans]|uniref:alkyl sulfatase dimerization domain-containing protein n=1 Tax=Nocardia elegans TaxID=300029 RepID=UPI0018960519|nr:alkyl sulfatase dimerization domain-containing protein [Nocardia elegans]MBF6451110.1 MBL fold metallo-hydrolase [Nocardia elegans]